MQQNQFAGKFSQVLADAENLFYTKNDVYKTELRSPTSGFEDISQELEIDVRKVILVYYMKHHKALVNNIVRDVHDADGYSRILDCINYLVMLALWHQPQCEEIKEDFSSQKCEDSAQSKQSFSEAFAEAGKKARTITEQQLIDRHKGLKEELGKTTELLRELGWNV